MMIVLSAVLSAFLSCGAGAPDDYLPHILKLTGCADVEELDERVVEKYSYYAEHPLRINLLSSGRLSSSGILSQYQCVTLSEYRSLSGDVMSVFELASIDGFGEELARALEPFVSFDSYSAPGSVADSSSKVYGALTMRGSARLPQVDDLEGRYGAKCYVESENLEMALGCNSSYDDKTVAPSDYTFGTSLYSKRSAGKVLIGDFNARFGQGLLLWSGFSLSSLSLPSTFCKRPSGLTLTSSFTGTGSFRGIAADKRFGKLILSAFLAADGLKSRMEGSKRKEVSLLPAVNLSLVTKRGHAAITGYAFGLKGDAVVSSDCRYAFQSAQIFSEVALNLSSGKPSFLAGCYQSLSDNSDLAVKVSCLSDKYVLNIGSSFFFGERVNLKGATGFAASEFRNVLNLSASATWPSLLRILGTYNCRLSPSLKLGLRLSAKANSNENEKTISGLRSDFKYNSGPWLMTLRCETVVGEKTSLLVYADVYYKTARLCAGLRGTVFKVDDWDCRIYSYERDAPGNFTVPAYYGRGYCLSAVGGLKTGSRRFAPRLYARFSHLSYPWQEEKKKPGRTELKLQCVFEF